MAKYIPIKIPTLGEDGLSQRESDMLSVQTARSQNFIGEHVECLNNEIYGHDNVPGLRTRMEVVEKQSGDNKSWITWLIRVLIVVDLAQAGGIGVSFMK